MQRSIEEINADFDRLVDEFDAEMRRLGLCPDPQRGDSLLREFARVGNLTFYECGTSSSVPVVLPSVREG
jgi:hypothetical protein